MDRVVFLHASDLHLGSPLYSSGRVPPELLEKIRNANYASFERLVDGALRHKVEFVLLCGDIYDREERSARAKRIFIDQMERLDAAGIPVYLVYGNHDSFSAQTGYFKYPDNVHVFPPDEVDMVEVAGSDGRLKARILGQSYSRQAEKRRIHEGYTPPARDLVNIGLLHTALDPKQVNYVPCSAGELKSIEGIDYWALGHSHKRRIAHPDYPTIAFPGIPQGRYMKEGGVGGCLLVTVQREQAAVLKVLPTSSVGWLTCQVPVKEDDSTEDDLLGAMAGQVEQILSGGLTSEQGLELAPGEAVNMEGYIVCWEFTGRGEIHKTVAFDDELAVLLAERMNREFAGSNPFIWTEEVQFKTISPLVDLENISPEDVVLQTLLQTYGDFGSDPEIRQEVINKMGNGWFEQADVEDTREKAIPLNEDTYDFILQSALQLAAECIMEGREQS